MSKILWMINKFACILLMMTIWAINIFMSIGVLESSDSQLLWSSTSSASICPAMPCWEIPLFSSSSMRNVPGIQEGSMAVKKKKKKEDSCPLMACVVHSTVGRATVKSWSAKKDSIYCSWTDGGTARISGSRPTECCMFFSPTEIPRTKVCLSVISSRIYG